MLLAITALAAGGWLTFRAIFPPEDSAKARGEVQRYYDEKWPNEVIVTKCAYVEDPEGSVFDTYDCHISVRCPRVVRFSVPRAATMSRADLDAAPWERARARCRATG